MKRSLHEEGGNEVVVIGPFPPPVHGMATTNAEVVRNLVVLGGCTHTINTASVGLSKSLLTRMRRLPAVVRASIRLLRICAAGCGKGYLSVSGGLGQLYELIFVLILRVTGARMYLRHCSFAYLEKPSLLARVLVWGAGPCAVHVTQCELMSRRLAELYGVQRAIAVSNAVLYSEDYNTEHRSRSSLTVVAFFGNISREKGVVEFVEVIRRLASKGQSLTAVVAGAFENDQIRDFVLDAVSEIRSLRYVGPKYGLEKDEFLAGVDLLLVPTRYKDETEAKVNHEAMCRGIPVIAYGRGCIPDLLSESGGVVIDPDCDFTEVAASVIAGWLADPSTFARASVNARARFKRTYEENVERWNGLLREICFS